MHLLNKNFTADFFLVRDDLMEIFEICHQNDFHNFCDWLNLKVTIPSERLNWLTCLTYILYIYIYVFLSNQVKELYLIDGHNNESYDVINLVFILREMLNNKYFPVTLSIHTQFHDLDPLSIYK